MQFQKLECTHREEKQNFGEPAHAEVLPGPSRSQNWIRVSTPRPKLLQCAGIRGEKTVRECESCTNKLAEAVRFGEGGTGSAPRTGQEMHPRGFNRYAPSRGAAVESALCCNIKWLSVASDKGPTLWKHLLERRESISRFYSLLIIRKRPIEKVGAHVSAPAGEFRQH
jgi:hypothetical protein